MGLPGNQIPLWSTSRSVTGEALGEEPCPNLTLWRARDELSSQGRLLATSRRDGATSRNWLRLECFNWEIGFGMICLT
jgi:hypothetical protein